MHADIDLVAPMNTPITAAAPGKVTFAGRRGECSNVIVIAHSAGLATLSGHLTRIGVHDGDCITAGAGIVTIGATGLSTGPHLYFEVLRGEEPVDPAQFIDLGSEEPDFAPAVIR